MKRNISKMLKHCLVYSLILIFGLPFGAIAFGADKASASEKKANVSKTEVVNKTASDTKEAVAQKKAAVPKPVTPKTKANLPDKKVAVIKLPKVVNLTYTISTNNVLTLNWNYSKLVDQYLVEWNIQNDSNVYQKFLPGSAITTKIDNLQSGTSYVVKVSVLQNNEKGRESTLNFKTTGVAPKSVASVSKVAVTTPAIGDGVSTSRQISVAPKSTSNVTSNPAPVTTPSPTPSPTAPKEGTTTGGWSKLLVALSILIIAAGAALGGYYGYEWLMLRSKDKTQEPPKSNSRW